MLIFTFGILQFGQCWRIIEVPVEFAKFINERFTVPRQPTYGIYYAEELSEHPE